MRKLIIIFILYSFLKADDVPYNTSPDWESGTSQFLKVTTGLAVADINNDGFKDIITASGNDILREKVAVYYNNRNGIFNTSPDWVSDDIDFHGHISAGDINKDGFIDILVSVFLGEDGFSSKGKVKVYYNNNGALETTPSFISEEFYCFSSVLGDADGDGDLDIAAACGEQYNSIYEESRIFINNNGEFNTNANWKTANKMTAMDPVFADFDRNGYLDVFFGAAGEDIGLYMADDNGSINTSRSWKPSEDEISINSVETGFIDDDIYPDLIFTDNDQLSGDGKIKMYSFKGSIPDSSYADWKSEHIRYASALLLNDMDNDNYLDLIYGGWWEDVFILKGNGNSFDSNPFYRSNTESVVEAMYFCDLGRESIETTSETITINTPTASGIYLSKQTIENIIHIKKNGTGLSNKDFTREGSKNWISFTERLIEGDEVTVDYEYSNYPDLIVTNWDQSKGNYIFYNKNEVSINDNEVSDYELLQNYPNPFNNSTTIRYSLLKDSHVNLKVYNYMGSEVKTLINGHKSKGDNNIVFNADNLSSGIYYYVLQLDNKRVSTKKMVYVK